MKTITKQEKSTACQHLAANIRLLRKRKKISQEELAQHVGLNRGNIASYENASAEPKISNLARIATFFGISISDIARIDLSKKEDLASLTRIEGLCEKERAKLEELQEEAVAFDDFLKGIYTCFCYKAKDLKHIDNLPQEAKFLQSHFEQLFNAASELSKKHLELLHICKTKE